VIGKNYNIAGANPTDKNLIDRAHTPLVAAIIVEIKVAKKARKKK
jgi:hypothetical protein